MNFDYAHLDALESQSVFLFREAYHKFKRLAMLWSIGKDSSVMLWLLRKAFLGHIPIPCVHVDTSYKIPEMIAFRDRLVKDWNINLIVGKNNSALQRGETFPNGRATRVQCCGLLKKDALQAVIEEQGFQAVIVGIRRDEEGTRAKERYFSPRDKNFEWNFKDQPPELWDQFKTDFEPGTHIRIHPLLHWTEVDIWQYINREKIPVVDLYFAQNGVRYRSLGCAPCTNPVPSDAADVPAIIQELIHTKISERSTRAQDQEAEDAFERLRASGYM
ncbi:MAG: sulfate adenylyltransferase subunit 2 [Verrucomicrobia bacterium]|nr:sulfate adenylyltransferase subunit 2 [Verrucomicrobiota bacterium]MBV9673789.1 sulfate adenylyltransferase subunit 2 [Verrucomicrobiota bacterium]